ncbi:MAG: hypothetical protein P9X24_01435 [Candidatus Hatepunaea meridiana]|nr:hypothetical protein [Candidatus Hatepunaea meridiana]
MIFRITIPLLILISQSVNANPSEEAWEAYLAGDFDRVEQLVITARSDQSLSPEQRATLYMALGCADAMRGRDAAAITSFEMALLLDSSIKLSPADLPPPVWKLFKPAADRISQNRSDIASQLSESENPKASVDEPPEKQDRDIPSEVVITDTITVVEPLHRKSSATIKSLVYPGWGHLAEDNRKGLIYAGIEAAAITCSIIFAIDASNARDDYMAVRDPEIISDRYNSYNRSYQLTWSFAALAAATYLTAQFDFFTTPPPVKLTTPINSHPLFLSVAINL